MAPAAKSTNGPTTAKDSMNSAKSATTHETSGGKPDQAAYNREQEEYKKEIDELQKKLAVIKDKIGLATNSKSGPGAERRATLLGELSELRSQQGDVKANRSKIFDQLKSLQDSISKKTKDLQASKSKVPFKSIPELEAHLQKLESQVEGGNMKLVDEKRALQEISTLKRQRRNIEGFQTEQENIDSEKAKADELRKQLDDPESKALAARYESIQAELDELKKEADESYNSRSKLFDERNALQEQLDVLFANKRESSAKYREASDRYWQKLNDDRARRAEKNKALRAAQEDEKRKEIADKIREEADILAYQAEIEDCQTLIDYFSGNVSTSVTGLDVARGAVAGVPQLELRKVEGVPQGTQLKKKGEEEDSYFIGGKGKKKGGKAGGGTPAAAAGSSGDKLNIPFPKLSALMSLSIPPPTSSADIPQTIENLKIKKEWFVANQATKTATNKAEAEKEIARLLKNMTVEKGEAGSEEKSGEAEDPTAIISSEAA